MARKNLTPQQKATALRARADVLEVIQPEVMFKNGSAPKQRAMALRAKADALEMTLKPITVLPAVMEEIAAIVWETHETVTLSDDEDELENCIIGYHENPRPTHGTFGHGAGFTLRPKF